MAVTTETGSEVIAQIALAWAIKKGRSLNVSDCVEVEKDNKGKPIMTKIGGIDNYVPVLDGRGNPILINGTNSPFSDPSIVTQSKANLSNKTFLVELCKWGLGGPKGSKGLTWIDGQGRNMLQLKNRLKFTKKGKIYNDKIYDFKSNKSPYKAFSRANTGSKPDKWNPADMWIMSPQGVREMSSFNNRLSRLNSFNIFTINNFLHKQYDEGNIFPISLKKLDPSSPHTTLVNSRYFVEQIDISNQRNPAIIEFTDDNQDVKINFTLRTIELPRGQSIMISQNRINNLSGRTVAGSEKRIMLKYNVNKEQLEAFFSQTGTTPGQARHGSVGKELFTKVISNTSRDGIKHLNTLKENYNDSDLELNKSTGYFISQRVSIDENNRATALGYLGTLWADIRGDNDTAVPGNFARKYGTKSDSVKKKIVAGEIGIAVGSITNAAVKTRVIQNLYNAAASIGIMSGVSKSESAAITAASRTATSKRLKPTMLGGIHIKVY